MAIINLSEIQYCYSVADIRALENFAIDEQGIGGSELMVRAGKAAFAAIKERYGSKTELHVFCGGGNNGGDGFVIAGLAADEGWTVCLTDLSNPEKLSAEAAAARNFTLERVQNISSELPDLASKQGLIVDALLGIGFSGDLIGSVLQACRLINNCALPVFAIDLPTGVDADTGACAEHSVRATTTISFIGCKRGLITGYGENCVGELILDDLNIKGLDIEGQDIKGASSLKLNPHKILSKQDLRQVFPPRFASAHKGGFGHLLIVGGNLGMAGAVVLAAEAALALGVGKLSVATRGPSLAPLLSRAPEAMVHQVDHYNYLKPLLDQCTAIVIGPGLGTDAWAEQMLHLVLFEDIPAVVDADAINLIAQGAVTPNHDRLCYTPHAGEAASILGSTASEIQGDRFAALENLESAFPGCWVLKGNGSLVSGEGGRAGINRTGNAGMASGGMGDVLSGLIGSVLAQGYGVQESAAAGVFLHGAAADKAAVEAGQISLRATDLIKAVPETLISLDIANA